MNWLPELDNTAMPSGCLYVVGMPIGNLKDVTLRALDVLNEADLILAEDTRNTLRFLTHYDIKTPLEAFHEHNEAPKTQKIVERLQAGKVMALVSDAGTPCVSDPGYRLVAAVVAAAVRVIPIPGASAAITALSASGMPSDGFVFASFLPRKSGKQKAMLERLASYRETLIFYESPKRVREMLLALQDVLGDRPAVLAREVTKLYEEMIRGTISEIITELDLRNSIKGECTVIVAGNVDETTEITDAIMAQIRTALAEKESVSQMAKRLAEETNVSKKKIYDCALDIKKEMEI